MPKADEADCFCWLSCVGSSGRRNECFQGTYNRLVPVEALLGVIVPLQQVVSSQCSTCSVLTFLCATLSELEATHHKLPKCCSLPAALWLRLERLIRTHCRAKETPNEVPLTALEYCANYDNLEDTEQEKVDSKCTDFGIQLWMCQKPSTISRLKNPLAIGHQPSQEHYQ